MTDKGKPVHALRANDLEVSPVWKYENVDVPDETLVRPVKNLPVKSLTGKLVGTQVILANGQCKWALIGNVDGNDARITQHFITVSIEHGGSWFDLARYHDFDYAERGPDALARFLGLSADDVFPIKYDIRQHAQGDPAALAGNIQRYPRERLTRAEIIALAVP